MPLAATEFAENIYWVYSVVLDPARSIDAESVMARLANYKIGTRPFFYPLHKQPALKLHLDSNHICRNSEMLSEYGFYLPSGLGLKDDDIEFVCQKLIQVLGQ